MRPGGGMRQKLVTSAPAARRNKPHLAELHAHVPRDDLAFGAENEEYVAVEVVDGFVVALALADDDVGAAQAFEEGRGDLVERRSDKRAAVVDDPANLGQPDADRVFIDDIVQHGRALHHGGDGGMLQKHLNEELVEHDFAGVVEQVQQILARLQRFPGVSV